MMVLIVLKLLIMENKHKFLNLEVDHLTLFVRRRLIRIFELQMHMVVAQYLKFIILLVVVIILVYKSIKLGESNAKSILAYLFITFLVYICLGILFNKIIKKEVGIVFPHIEFWKDFPKLVIDGIKYI